MKKIATLAALAVTLLLATAPAALAHGDDGFLELAATTPSGAMTSSYDVVLRYSGDGEPVSKASVTIVAERPGSTPIGPTVMTAGTQPGHYTATITFPTAGEWTVRFSSISPRATLEQAQTVKPAPTTTTAPATTTTLPTLDLRPGDTDSGGSKGPGILVAALVATVIVGVTVYVLRGRR